MGRITSAARRLGDRELARDTMWGFGQEGVTLLGTLVSFSLLGRSLGSAGYGQYASLYAIIGPLGTLAASGVTLAQAQHIIRDGEDLEITTRSCLSMTLAIGCALTVVGAGIAAYVVQGLALTAILCVLLLEFVSYPAVLIAANTVQVRDGFAASTKVRLIPVASRIGVIFLLFFFGNLTIFSLGLSYLSVTAVLAIVLLRRTSHRYDITIRPGHVSRRHLKTSAVYSAGISGLSLQNDGDKAVLAANRFQTDTGLYSAAYRIVQFGLIPVGSFVAVTHNRFLEHEEGRKRQHLMRSIKFGGVCAAYGTVFAVAIILAAPLMTVLLGDGFKESIPMVRMLAPLVPLRSLAIFPLNGLMGLGKTFARTVLLLAGAAVSMALYIVLIPQMQWRGAALGTIIGEAFLAVAAWALLLYHQRRSDMATDSATEAAIERADIHTVSVGLGTSEAF